MHLAFWNAHRAHFSPYTTVLVMCGGLLSRLCTIHTAMAPVSHSTSTSSFGVCRALLDSYRALLAVHRALLAVNQLEVYRAVLDSIQGSFECAHTACSPHFSGESLSGAYMAFWIINTAFLDMCRALLDSIQGSFECA